MNKKNNFISICENILEEFYVRLGFIVIVEPEAKKRHLIGNDSEVILLYFVYNFSFSIVIL